MEVLKYSSTDARYSSMLSREGMVAVSSSEKTDTVSRSLSASHVISSKSGVNLRTPSAVSFCQSERKQRMQNFNFEGHEILYDGP